MTADKRTQVAREGFQRNSADLRRARAKYAGQVRAWVEAATHPRLFRARLYHAASRARVHGLYAESSTERQVMFGLLTHWRRADQISWWPWMHADKRRASVADWSIKTAQIRDDAKRFVA